MDQPRLRMLLDGLHNAPLLEQLTIAATVFKIDDMEDLHINLPYLKQLTLYDIYQHTDDQQRTITSKLDMRLVKNNLKSFSISFTPDRETTVIHH